MNSMEELLRLSMQLRKGQRYFRWPINRRQAWVRDRGQCLASMATTDHVLPKSLYPELAEHIENLVPACGECNCLKRDYDPCHGEVPIPLNAKSRHELIVDAHNEIERRRKVGDWRNEFQKAAASFKTAVEQYQDCLAEQHC